MTRRTVATIKAQWPLLVMVAAIFMSGWTIEANLASRIDARVDAAERRIDARFNRDFGELKADVRRIADQVAPLTYQRKGP